MSVVTKRFGITFWRLGGDEINCLFKKDNALLDVLFSLSVGNDKCPRCLKEFRVYHSYSTIMFDIFTYVRQTIVQESIKSREMFSMNSIFTCMYFIFIFSRYYINTQNKLQNKL